MNPEFVRMVSIFGIARKPEWEVWMIERHNSLHVFMLVISAVILDCS